jgi:DNA-binding MarR family transcriptional regulator
MPATTTTDAVLAALEQRPDTTTAELAAAAGLGRSTAGKALAALERDGRVRRTLGGHDGGRQRPDRWTTSPPADADQLPDTSRLREGQLRALVLEHLQQHPEVEHGPTAIAKALGRSAGAVSNALDRLAADGTVVQTNLKPRRFTATRT